MLAECQKRVVLMGGDAPQRKRLLFAVSQRTAVNLPFAGPAAVKRDDIEIHIVQLQRGGQNSGEGDGTVSLIFNVYTVTDHIRIPKHSIQQGNP